MDKGRWQPTTSKRYVQSKACQFNWEQNSRKTHSVPYYTHKTTRFHSWKSLLNKLLATTTYTILLSVGLSHSVVIDGNVACVLCTRLPSLDFWDWTFKPSVQVLSKAYVGKGKKLLGCGTMCFGTKNYLQPSTLHFSSH